MNKQTLTISIADIAFHVKFKVCLVQNPSFLSCAQTFPDSKRNVFFILKCLVKQLLDDAEHEIMNH